MDVKLLVEQLLNVFVTHHNALYVAMRIAIELDLKGFNLWT